jgi:cobalt transporter subunit CbtB
MTAQVSSNQQIQAKSTTSVLAQGLAALVFGIAIIFAVGFAPMEVAHSAAHDARHSLAFPCH